MAQGYRGGPAEDACIKSEILVARAGMFEPGSLAGESHELASSWPAATVRKKYEPPKSPVIRPSPPGSPLWDHEQKEKERALENLHEIEAMDFALPEHEDELSPLDGEGKEEHHIKFNMVGFDDPKSDDEAAPVCKQASTLSTSSHLAVPEARRRFESAPPTMGIGASPMLRAALDMVAADHALEALEQFQLDDPHSDEDRSVVKPGGGTGGRSALGPGASPILLSALDGVAASVEPKVRPRRETT